jgi:hypothetical protein
MIRAAATDRYVGAFRLPGTLGLAFLGAIVANAEAKITGRAAVGCKFNLKSDTYLIFTCLGRYHDFVDPRQRASIDRPCSQEVGVHADFSPTAALLSLSVAQLTL